MNEIKYVDFETLEKLMQQILMAAGVPEQDAKIVADVLIQADKLGIDSHGINRLKPIYIDRIKQGILNPVTEIEVIKDSPTTTIFDGHNGMGHVVAKTAMQRAIDKARRYGLGMSAVRNSTHYGIAGYYALMATKQDMIGITGTNARPSIAPTFGVENMMGTNPLTFGIPTDEAFPFLLDCATSVTQRGKIEYYARNGMDTPPGLVIDQSGDEMTDSVKILQALVAGEAALLPLGGKGEENGGYKGYGYAAVVEILSAALAGGSFLKMLTGFDEQGNRIPYPLGHFFLAIDTDHFIGKDAFKKIAGQIVEELRQSAVAPGEERIYTAGEKEYLVYAQRKNQGIPIGETLQKEINDMIKEFSIKGFDLPF